MNRIEMKFIVPFADYFSFRERLKFYATRDLHSLESGQYPIFSTYFDTHDLEFYHDKIEGEFEHVKIRLRGYAKSLAESEVVFLESKIKHNKFQTKIRVPFQFGNQLDKLESSLLESEHPDLSFFQEQCGKKSMRPACNVYYNREAFSLKCGFDDIRINFDTDILYLHRNEQTVQPIHFETRQLLVPGTVVMEIKHSDFSLPSFLQKELNQMDTSITTFSKYANSVDRLLKFTDFSGALK